MATKKVVIGGGTGFIGQRLGELLRNNKFDVLNMSRMPGTSNKSWSELEACGLPDNTYAVVNCAGQQFMDFSKRWTPGFKQNVYNSRVFTTRALATAIDKALVKPKVFVVITGVGAYEPSECNKYDEDSPTATGKDFFSKLVVEWEKAAQVSDPEVRIVIIRSGAVLGRWGGMIKNMFMPFYFGVGGPIGSGKQYLPWIHIDDLTRMIMFAIDNKEVRGILNGVAPQVITNAEFTKSFANALNRPAFISVPEMFLNKVLDPERAMIITKGQYVVPLRVLKYGFIFEYRCIDEACKELAQYTPLQIARNGIFKKLCARLKAFASALTRPAFLPVPEIILNVLLNPERAMIMTKGQHVEPKNVVKHGFKYRYPNIKDACKEFAYLFPKK